MALRRGKEIGVVGFIFGGPCTTDPIHGLASWIELRDDALCRMPSAQTGDTQRFDVVKRLIGDAMHPKQRRILEAFLEGKTHSDIGVTELGA